MCAGIRWEGAVFAVLGSPELTFGDDVVVCHVAFGPYTLWLDRNCHCWAVILVFGLERLPLGVNRCGCTVILAFGLYTLCLGPTHCQWVVIAVVGL